MKHSLKAFDSDMHVYDAADLYDKYMNPKWGHRIPRGQRNGKHGRVEFSIGGSQKLRAITDAPIIILSALTQKDNVVRGLRQGADDYVGKPFAGDEVIARVEAALRRSGPKTPVSKIAFPENGLSMDLETHQASYRGNTIDLTPREFSVLEILAKHHPKPVSYETLATEVWGQDNEKIRERIKWIVYLLRQKIEKDPSNPKLILNKTRYGYHLAVE